jgi:hypothetical protein
MVRAVLCDVDANLTISDETFEERMGPFDNVVGITGENGLAVRRILAPFVLALVEARQSNFWIRRVLPQWQGF